MLINAQEQALGGRSELAKVGRASDEPVSTMNFTRTSRRCRSVRQPLQKTILNASTVKEGKSLLNEVSVEPAENGRRAVCSLKRSA